MRRVFENSTFTVRGAPDTIEVENKGNRTVVAIDIDKQGRMMVYQLGAGQREMILGTHPDHEDCPVLILSAR